MVLCYALALADASGYVARPLAVGLRSRPTSERILPPLPRQTATLNEWLPADEVRILSEDEDVRDKGWTADVRRGNSWRRSRILKRNGNLFFVHYVCESNNYDEWSCGVADSQPARLNGPLSRWTYGRRKAVAGTRNLQRKKKREGRRFFD